MLAALIIPLFLMPLLAYHEFFNLAEGQEVF